MVNIIRVLTYEISRTLRRKGFLFATFGLPLLLFALTFVWRAVSPTPEQMIRDASDLAAQFDGIERAAVVDLSGQFDGIETDQLVAYPDEESALAALERGDVETVYIIPTDYAETREARQIIPRMALDAITGGPLVALAAESLSGVVDEDRILRLQVPSTVTTVDLNAVDADGNPISSDLTADEREDAGFALVYLFAMIFMLTTFTGSGYLMQSVIEEKENRLIEVLITSVRPSQLLAGKVLASAVMSLFQVVVWVVIAIVLSRAQGDFLSQAVPFLATIAIPTGPLPFVVLFFLLGFFMFAAVFGMVGAISNSAQEGPQWTVVFVLPAMIPLWAAPAIIAEPNGTLATVLSFFPITAPIGMTARLVLTDVPFVQIALSLLILLAFTVFLYWLAGRIFRVQILLSGKLPGIRDLPRLIFGS